MRRKAATMLAAVMLLSVLSFAEQTVVRRVTDSALAQTQSILEEIQLDRLDRAKQKAHALDRAWDRQANMLEMMVDHRSTDDVRYALSRLLAALECGDRAAAMIYAGELEGGIEHVLERQTLSLQNLL